MYIILCEWYSLLKLYKVSSSLTHSCCCGKNMSRHSVLVSVRRLTCVSLSAAFSFFTLIVYLTAGRPPFLGANTMPSTRSFSRLHPLAICPYYLHNTGVTCLLPVSPVQVIHQLNTGRTRSSSSITDCFCFWANSKYFAITRRSPPA